MQLLHSRSLLLDQNLDLNQQHSDYALAQLIFYFIRLYHIRRYCIHLNEQLSIESNNVDRI